MLFCKTINNYCKDVVLKDPHIFSINKCCNYTDYTIFKDGYSCADSQVSQLAANAKVIQKTLSFSKRMWLTI